MTGSLLSGASGCITTSASDTPTVTDEPDEEPTTSETSTNQANDDSKSHDNQAEDSESHQGDDNSHHHEIEPLESPVQHADIAMISDDSHHFEPHLVWIKAGGSVTWTNESGKHTTTAYHEANERPHRLPENTAGWDSGLLESNQTFERTFDVAGVYDYGESRRKPRPLGRG